MDEAIAYLRQGGWPMIPLALCSLAALAVVIERSFALRRARALHPSIVDAVAVYGGGDSVESLLRLCLQIPCSVARVLEDSIGARGLGRSQVMETMHASGRREVGLLERGLIVLEIVAGISPLIGLLGTVLGMVTVFEAITASGIGDAQVLAEGIGEALITTITGLCIAIPSFAFHSVLSRRVEQLGIEMEDLATGFITRMYDLPGDSAQDPEKVSAYSSGIAPPGI